MSLLLAAVLGLVAADARPSPWGAKDWGVLLLGHGGTSQWNKAVEEIRAALKPKFPIEAASGRADAREIQRAIDRLRAQRVKKVVAVPLFVSSRSDVMEQTKYVLGLSQDPSREFLEAPNSSSGYAVIKRVQHPLPLVLTSALDDHPLVCEVLAARAKEMSRAPAREAVVLVGRGAFKDEDNELRLKALEGLGRAVQGSGGFASVHAATVREDSPPEPRRKAAEALRKLVNGLSRKGRVLVVPHLVEQDGIDRHIRRSLEGMFYAWTGKTLLPDPRITRWVELKAEEAAKLPDMRRFKDAGRPPPQPERKPLIRADAGAKP